MGLFPVAFGASWSAILARLYNCFGCSWAEAVGHAVLGICSQVDFDHAACWAKFVDRTALGVGDRVINL